ncbi:EAL domain-containing protein [Marinobacterium sp. AK62]|uniref:EAL domain-containing protein n=1 Tax=Marinobacterium alkalitolerans TaxID=1542925 RepID=A0ABS3ZAH6_9GAMM|nr:EAL domain-containing protein [Marinobacterium alkalitolerans]MBP0048313.1 EAL domain-containing protein [Marinobacterium alkalitolerans]
MSPPLERNVIALSSLQGSLIALALMVIIGTWIFAGYQLGLSRDKILEEHTKTLTNLSLVVSENINQVLDRTRAMKVLSRMQLLKRQSHDPGTLAALIGSDPAFSRITLITHSGETLLSTSPGPLPALHPEWKTLLTQQERWPIRVLPTTTLGESWSVPLVMPLEVGQEDNCCLLVLDMDMGYLLSLYQNLKLGRETSIHIATAQGVELLRAERGGLIAGASGFDDTVVLKSRLSQGRVVSRHPQNRRDYLGYFVKLEQAPFVIQVRQSELEALATYHQQRNKYLASVIVMTLIAIGGLFWLLWVMHGREVQMRELQKSEQRNTKLLKRLRREHQDTIEAASRDHLTGLYNRRLFIELAHSQLLGSKRQGRFAAICFIDLDRFKTINDTLGHKVGDNLLQEVARRLRETLRESDIISRFGGDEFVAMLTAVKHQEDVEAKVQQLVEVLAAPYPELEAAGLGTSPSIGVAISPRDGLDIETLVKHADMAMYRAKKAGRGRYCLFDSHGNPHASGDADLQFEVANALQRGEFRVHYQPRLRLRGYETTGFEALLRWESPEYGLILPDTFLPWLEAEKLMPQLTRSVLEQVGRQLKEWREQGLTPLPIAVNVNSAQLSETALPGQVRNLIETNRLDPGWLELEVGDQDLRRLDAEAIEHLQLVRQQGVGLVMDDFGASEEGLELVSRLSFKRIKLSRALIQHIRNSFDDNVLLSATISVARKQNLSVVAKGVETPDQLVYLKLAGCQEAQGFLFSRALEPDAVKDYLLTPKRKVTL